MCLLPLITSAGRWEMGTYFSLHRLGSSCFVLSSSELCFQDVAACQPGPGLLLPCTQLPHNQSSRCLSSRWGLANVHSPPGPFPGRPLSAHVQVRSPQPLTEDCLAGPFPRPGQFCLLVLKPTSSPSACVFLTLLLPFLESSLKFSSSLSLVASNLFPGSLLLHPKWDVA